MKDKLNKLIELIAIIKIIASPFLIGLFLGVICIAKFQNMFGLLLAVTFSIFGLGIGLLFFKRVKKTSSAEDFNSKIYATPDIDEALKK
jgi:hypothetical protein